MRERRDAWAQRKRGGGVESVADTVFVMGMDMYLTSCAKTPFYRCNLVSVTRARASHLDASIASVHSTVLAECDGGPPLFIGHPDRPWDPPFTQEASLVAPRRLCSSSH